LLTLTGPGGIGKTRLALALADSVLPDYADGVWLVELAALQDPSLVPNALAAALGIRELPNEPLMITLRNTLRDRQQLLVVDNCEHILDGCVDLISGLLADCERLRILTTTREMLGIRGEKVWRVPGLRLPEPDARSGAQKIAGSEAVGLFVERARAAQPDFVLTEQNAAVVSQICRQLDGLPLAIELAAARLKLLDLEEIADRLQTHFRILASRDRTSPARQQTLRAAIEWSYRLLSDMERLLFDRLSVFDGGWTLDAAERVAAGGAIRDSDVLDLLEQLVDKSLVLVDNSIEGPRRYRLLVTLRQYALEHLVESGEADVCNHRLTAYMADFAERAESELRAPQSRRFWMRRRQQEHDNVRAALGWAVKQDLYLALRLAVAAWPFWEMRLYLREGRAWLEQVVESSAGQEAFTLLRGRALLGLAVMVRLQGDSAVAAAHLSDALDIFSKLGDKGRQAAALNGLGLVAMDAEDLSAADRHFSESVTLCRAENQFDLQFALLNLARVVELQGDEGRAQSLLEESLASGRDFGDARGPLPARVALARLARRRGDREGALALLRESLAQVQSLGLNRATVIIFDALAWFALEDGQFGAAARLLGGAAGVVKSADFTPVGQDQPEHLRTLAAVRAHLGEEEFAAAWEEGQSLSLEDQVSRAMALLDSRTA
jgi:predicted ATPase